MSTQTPTLDWQVLLDDAEWGRTEPLSALLDTLPAPAALPRSSQPFPPWLRVMAGLLTLLVLVAGEVAAAIEGKYMTILRHQPDGSWKLYRDIFNANVP